MFRFIITVIFLISFLILSIPLLLFEWVFAKINRRAADISSLRIVQWAFKVIIKIAGIDITFIGKEKIPSEPVLYIGNHRSFYDIIITYAYCQNLTGYVAKKEMLKAPLLRDWMKRLYCLFLDRENPKEGLKTILQAIDYVKSGVSICIFPEGTRNKGEELSLLPFHAGSFKIAEKSGCPIVPMSINNTAFVFEEHFPRIKKTRVIIEYGDPIYPKSLTREAKKTLSEDVRQVIKATIDRNQTLL
ncbi:MAG TPA: 1-acyl-sn-glycerol-3-phosphate acyltransferase [Candidatus Dorea intestinavium]|nr:1-acyl-sn-glycerol-3-phosphate acyltransferase [Candidatus Dorea intestinavium]